MRLSWNALFKKKGKEWCTVAKLRIGGVTIDKDICFTKDSMFWAGGVNLSLFIGRDLDIQTEGETAIILGIF